MDNIYSEFNKSDMVKEALKSRSGVFFPSEDADVQNFWERLASITTSIKTRYADDKIHHVSISKIEGYDFLDDLLEELIFLEDIFFQINKLNTNEFQIEFSPKDSNIRTVEYIEYNSEKYKEIETHIRNYGSATKGLMKIKVNVKPLIKIYNRLSFVSGGERMETTITNITESQVVMGDNNEIKDSFNKTNIESIPSDIINMINSQKDDLLSAGITNEQIEDLMNAPTESKIEKFNKKLLPHIGTAANLATLVSSLSQLIN